MFKGKAIYNPSGKALEYAPWACNFVVGCPNDCEYCYCKSGPLGNLWSKEQRLKKCFKDEKHALDVFESELSFNIVELQKHGLFFTFTSDPFAEPFRQLHMDAWGKAVHEYDVNVTVCTKMTDWIDSFLEWINKSNSDNASLEWRKNICFMFTLTGCDYLEPGASTNRERCEGMKKLHDNGFRTAASIEPIIDFDMSYEMIYMTRNCCDHYKIGLLSHQKVDMSYYNKLRYFNLQVVNALANTKATVYWKDSFTKHFGQFPDAGMNVDVDYNIFHE